MKGEPPQPLELLAVVDELEDAELDADADAELELLELAELEAELEALVALEAVEPPAPLELLVDVVLLATASEVPSLVASLVLVSHATGTVEPATMTADNHAQVFIAPS